MASMAGPEPRRWIGVGHSTATDSREAGADAARTATVGRDPRLVVVLASIAHDHRQVLDGVRSVTGAAPLIGCSTHSELWRGGPSDGTVLVTVLGGDGFAVTTAAAPGAAGRQRAAGVELARALRGEDPERPRSAMLLLTDSLLRDQEEILRGVYEVFGASVPVVGGAAADRWAMDRTFQFVGDEVLHGSAVAAVVHSDGPIGIAVGHGWRPVGEPMTVTRCENGRVLTLDDEPAMDAFLRRAGAPDQAYTDVSAFRRFALTRPIGIERRAGTEVRNLCTEVDVAGRSIGGGGDIPQGALVWLMEGDGDSILEAASATCDEAIGALEGLEPLGILVFSCSALRSVLGADGTVRESERIAKAAAAAPFAGFHTCGEIARTRGIDGFHNQTHVVLALA